MYRSVRNAGSAARALSLLMIMLASAGLGGCAGLFAFRADSGSLTIAVARTSARSILPPSESITSTKFRIRGTGPDGAGFGPSGITSSSTTIGNLAPGEWSVTVESLNAADAVIAACTRVVTIEKYKTAHETFQLLPVPGTGTLSVVVSWPANTATVAKAVGTLTPAITGKDGFTFLKSELAPVDGTYSATATISELPTGSYSLKVQFQDAGGSQIGPARLAAATIFNGMTSSGTISMTETLFPVEAPTFSPASGTLLSTQTVSIATTSADTAIRYTTDGSDPSMVSQEYSGPFALSGTSASITVKAIAVRSGDGASSAISTVTYSYLPPPTFSPASGTYASAQTVSLSSVHADAAIYFTADGSTPTTSSTRFTGSLSVSQNTTLKAIAVKSGVSSATASAAFLIKAAMPTANPAGGSYTQAQTVTLSTATAGASIYYTIDGSTPSSTNGALYAAPISIASSLTLKAITRSPSHANSDVLTAAYTISGTVASPIFSEPGGTYYAALTVRITSEANTTIRYTTDGTNYSQSPSNTVDIPISKNTFLTAYATNGTSDSQAVAAQYVIATQVEAPVVSLSPGIYSADPLLTLGTPTPGASLYYSTDGSVPTSASTLYAGPISLGSDGSTLTVKAIAIKAGLMDSVVVEGTYTWDSTCVSTPQISPAGGIFSSSQSVRISCPTEGATIYYSTDGSDPGSSSTLYAGPFTVSTNQTVKAVAYRTGMTRSTVASATFSFAKPAPATLVAVGQFKKIAVTWPPVPGALSYNLYYLESYRAGDTFNTATYTGKVTNAVSGITFTTYGSNKQLNNGITIAYLLTAVYGSGESPASGIVYTTPR